MQLTLSHYSPLNAVYSNEEGQAIYKVHCPFKVVGRTASISRITPNDDPNSEDMQDKFVHLAEIEWRAMSPSVIRWGGNEISTKTFFRKGGYKGFGRGRIFTALDGLEYRWELGLSVSALYLNDEAKTPVARFHRRHLGVIKTARNAFLEILPAGEHMVDMIVVTFIYIEKKRKDRERSAKYNHGGGGGGG